MIAVFYVDDGVKCCLLLSTPEVGMLIAKHHLERKKKNAFVGENFPASNKLWEMIQEATPVEPDIVSCDWASFYYGNP